MQTLKHIVLNMHFVGPDDHSLYDLPSEFEDMRNKNIIETVTIRLLDVDTNWRRVNWSRLDEVLTAPGWFLLERVSVVAKISCCNASELDELDRKSVV